MKNRGQVLVAFLLLLPILIVLLGMLFEIGSLTVSKHSFESSVKRIVETGLKEQQSEEEVRNLIASNFEHVTILKISTGERLELQLTISVKSLFTRLFHTNQHQITIFYVAYEQDGIIKVEKG